MNYNLMKDLVSLVEAFSHSNENRLYSSDIDGFSRWVADSYQTPVNSALQAEPEWDGKENARTPDSVISTLLVHMNRYARSYSKSAIYGSSFSTQEEFIYLIVLKAYGSMTKMELIKRNVQDKPTGMQIVNRLIDQGWVVQKDSETDKRSKIIQLTQKGLQTLEQQMAKIRQATKIVTGDLTYNEKMDLIRLLNKLDHFHKPIFSKNIQPSELLERVTSEFLPSKS